MLACLHNPVQHVQSGFIPLDTQHRDVPVRALRASEAAQLRVTRYWGSLLPAVSPLTSCLLPSISHPCAFLTSVGDGSVELFLLVLFIFPPLRISHFPRIGYITPAQCLSTGGEHSISFD